MQISNQLLKPIIDRLYDEYRELNGRLVLRPSEETDKLKAFIQKKLQQLERLESEMVAVQPHAERALYSDWPFALRQLKLGLRIAQRRWKRILLNEVRFKKGQGKTSLMAAYAS
jgi:hypothetical protein